MAKKILLFGIFVFFSIIVCVLIVISIPTADSVQATDNTVGKWNSEMEGNNKTNYLVGLNSVVFENYTGTPLDGIYISNKDSNNWGFKLNAEIIKDGGTLTFSMDQLEDGDDIYDFGSIDHDGLNYDIFDVQINAGDTLSLKKEGEEAVLTVTSLSGEKKEYRGKTYNEARETADTNEQFGELTSFTFENNTGDSINELLLTYDYSLIDKTINPGECVTISVESSELVYVEGDYNFLADCNEMKHTYYVESVRIMSGDTLVLTTDGNNAVITVISSNGDKKEYKGEPFDVGRENADGDKAVRPGRLTSFCFENNTGYTIDDVEFYEVSLVDKPVKSGARVTVSVPKTEFEFLEDEEDVVYDFCAFCNEIKSTYIVSPIKVMTGDTLVLTKEGNDAVITVISSKGDKKEYRGYIYEWDEE